MGALPLRVARRLRVGFSGRTVLVEAQRVRPGSAMTTALDVPTLVSRAALLSSTKTGLDELQTSLQASSDVLKTNVNEALQALEQGALSPKQHALAWVYFLNAAVQAATPEETKPGDASGLNQTESGPNNWGDDNKENNDAPPALVDPTDADQPIDMHDEPFQSGMTSTPTPGDFNMDTHGLHVMGGFLDGGVGRGIDDARDLSYDTHDTVPLPDPVQPTVVVTKTFPEFRKLAKQLLMESDDVLGSVDTDGGSDDATATGVSSMDVANGSVDDALDVTASSQLRRVPKMFASICAAFKTDVYDIGIFTDLVACITPLTKSLNAARPTKHHLTKQHSLLFQTSLDAKRVDVVLKELDTCPIYECDPTKTGIDALDYLHYCDLCGTALAEVGRYDEAAEVFLRAVTAPANGAVRLHAALHKKYIMTSLLGSSSAVPFLTTLPRYASSAVQRHVRSATHAYVSFSEAFASKSLTKLNSKISELTETFTTDGNFFVEMASRSELALRKVNVQRLTKTHLSVSLRDIAESAGLTGGAQEAEHVVLSMIAEYVISARIDSSSKSVSFLDSVDDPSFAETEARKVIEAVKQARELAERVRRKNDDVRASKAYIAATSDFGQQGLGGKTGGARGDAGKTNEDGAGAMFFDEGAD